MAPSGPFSKFTDALPYIESTLGMKKEVWMAFDMDETLAYWDFYLTQAQKGNKKLDALSFFQKYDRAQQIIRPSVIPFFKALLTKGIRINFAIYSNSQKKDRLEVVARTIENALGSHAGFRVCFLFYNHFPVNPAEAEPKRADANIAGINAGHYYKAEKTMESIMRGYESSGHPLTDPASLFFFDDKEYADISSKIGSNYILVEEYHGKAKEGAEPVQASSTGKRSFGPRWGGGRSRRTHRTRRGGLKKRKTKRRAH